MSDAAILALSDRLNAYAGLDAAVQALSAKILELAGGPVGYEDTGLGVVDDAINGASAGEFLIEGGTAPYTVTITEDLNSIWRIANGGVSANGVVGVEVNDNTNLAGIGNTELSFKVTITDTNALSVENVLISVPITAATPALNPITGISLSANNVAFDAANATPIGDVALVGGEGDLSACSITVNVDNIFALAAPAGTPPVGALTVGDNTSLAAKAGTNVNITIQVSDSASPTPQTASFEASIAVSGTPVVYTPVQVHFNGADDWLSLGAGLTGAVDGKTGTLVGHFNPDDFTPAANQHIVRQGTPNFVATLFLDVNGDLNAWAKNAAGVEIMKLRIPAANFTAGQLNHFAFSWDTADVLKCHGYANDVEALTVDLLTDDTIDYTPGEWGIGASPGGGNKYAGILADLAFWPVNTDFSVLATRRKFVGVSGAPVDLGADGSTAAGSPALFLFSGDAASWHTNKGSGGGFTLNGDLVDADPPPDPGTTVHVATPVTFSTIQAAIDVASPGDTVLIPNGTHSVGNGQFTDTKGIHLKGNGMNLCTLQRTAGSPSVMYAVRTDNFEVSGIEFRGLGWTNSNNDKAIEVYGGRLNQHIHHNRFIHFGSAAVRSLGDNNLPRQNPTGRIHHNEFIDNGRADQKLGGYSYALIGNRDEWGRALGSGDLLLDDLVGTCIWFDNNLCRNNRHSPSTNNSARIVALLNTMIDVSPQPTGVAVIDCHGKQIPNGWEHGALLSIFAANDVSGHNTKTGGNIFAGLGPRGGCVIGKGNNVSDTVNVAVWLAQDDDDRMGDPWDAFFWNNSREGVMFTEISPSSGDYQNAALYTIGVDVHISSDANPPAALASFLASGVHGVTTWAEIQAQLDAAHPLG